MGGGGRIPSTTRVAIKVAEELEAKTIRDQVLASYGILEDTPVYEAFKLNEKESDVQFASFIEQLHPIQYPLPKEEPKKVWITTASPMSRNNPLLQMMYDKIWRDAGRNFYFNLDSCPDCNSYFAEVIADFFNNEKNS